LARCFGVDLQEIFDEEDCLNQYVRAGHLGIDDGADLVLDG
jgi:hypothetical protein